MLVLTRKPDEKIVLKVAGIEITIVVVETARDRVKLGIDAPREVTISRPDANNQTPTKGRKI
jgi:carbon storage regulator CsrA